MGATEAIVKMVKENNGTVTTAMAVASGFSRGNIKYYPLVMTKIYVSLF